MGLIFIRRCYFIIGVVRQPYNGNAGASCADSLAHAHDNYDVEARVPFQVLITLLNKRFLFAIDASLLFSNCTIISGRSVYLCYSLNRLSLFDAPPLYFVLHVDPYGNVITVCLSYQD